MLHRRLMTIWLTAAALELIGHTVHGASPQSCEDKEGVDVGIGIYINNVAVVNSEYGTANLDFYVYFQAVKCQYPNDAGNDDYSQRVARVFNNAGENIAVQAINKFNKGTNMTTQFRVKGRFTYSSDIRLWPFETQEVLLAIEDPKNPKHIIQFHPLPELTKISPTVTSPGWLLHSRNASHDVLEYTIRDVTYPQGGTFSRYELKLALTRPALSGFVKDILPPLFICLVQFFSFSINPENVVIRISMMGAGLTAAVMFHVQIAADRPPTTYLLFADKFMTAVYAIIVYNGIAAALILHQVGRKGNEEKSKRIHRRTEIIMLFAAPATGVSLLMDFYDISMGWELATVMFAMVLGYFVSYTYDYRNGLLTRTRKRQTHEAIGREPLLEKDTSYSQGDYDDVRFNRKTQRRRAAERDARDEVSIELAENA